MLSYDVIKKFLVELFKEKGKIFDEKYQFMWIKEISATKADISALEKAKKELIENNMPLSVFAVCEAIKSKIQRVEYIGKKCEYCKGKGLVHAIKFEKNKRYIPSVEYILNCVCENRHIKGCQTMTENKETYHKTICKDGYFRIFGNITEQWNYINLIKKNNNLDVM